MKPVSPVIPGHVEVVYAKDQPQYNGFAHKGRLAQKGESLHKNSGLAFSQLCNDLLGENFDVCFGGMIGVASGQYLDSEIVRPLTEVYFDSLSILMAVKRVVFDTFKARLRDCQPRRFSYPVI